MQQPAAEAGIAERPPAQRSAPPVHALIVGMQRSVGNRAFARLARRPSPRMKQLAVQRLTKEEVQEILADKKGRAKVWEKARKLYNDNFGLSGQYYHLHDREDWDWFVEKADSVENLLNLIEASVAKATAQKKAAPPAAVLSPPSSSTSGSKPAPAKSTSGDELSTDSEEEVEKPSAQSPQKKEKKSRKFVKLDLESIPARSQWTGTVPAAVSKPPSGNVLSPPKQPSHSVALCTSALESWSPVAHGGKRATDLTLSEAQDVVRYALNSYSRAGKVFVIKGAGSGEYAARVQLKIVHKTQTIASSGKKATFHITLSQNVFDQLNLAESDE